jgi:hypothetical protein
VAITNPIVSTAEVQTVTVDATGGTFTVTWNGATTGTIAFNASGATFSAAMDTVTDRAGECVVTGGPGAAGGGTPYTLTWSADKGNVPAPTTDATSLTGGAGTAVVATTTPGVSRLADPYLSIGEHTAPTHPIPDQGDWQWCMMEAAAWMAGESWTTDPANVSPVITAICNSFNDLLPDAERQGLKAYLAVAPAGVIDTVDGAKETAREWMCSDWLVRTLLPMYLDYSIDTDVLAASTAIKALAPLAAGWTGEAATLAALEDAGRAVWAWRATLEPEAFEVSGGGSPTFAAASLVTLFDSLGGDYIDHWFGLVRGVDGLTSTGSDNGGQAMTTAIRAMRQAVWDTCLTWVPNEFFTGRSVDYAFRRGGDYVPGSAFMLIRECVQALVAGQALSDVATLAYTEPNESGFYDYYAAAYDAANDHLVSLGIPTDAQASMVDLIADLAAY